MLAGLRRLFGGRVKAPQPEAATGRPRCRHDTLPDRLYAIGDVHGCLSLLQQLEDTIIAEARAAGETATLVYLGDLVDRGPEVPGVIDHLLATGPADLTRLFVAGNHEQAMLDFLDGHDPQGRWLELGGMESLTGYGLPPLMGPARRRTRRDLVRQAVSYIPEEHVQFLRGMPVLHAFPGFVFAHAGVRRSVDISDHTDADLMSIRGEAIGSRDGVVVHGHTPVETPVVSVEEINVDTGAYATGRLTAVRILKGVAAGTLSARTVPDAPEAGLP